MEIKNANLKDLFQILELQKLCYQENAERYHNYQIPPLTQTLRELENELSYSIILKVEIDSQIIGSIRAYKKDGICHIGRVIVHPDYQNRGIGTKMMMEIEKQFSDVSKYELFTGFKDEKNLHLYKKLGYKIFKEEVHEGVKFIFLQKKNNN